MRGETSTPYSTVADFIREEALWVSEFERERIGAYKAYEDMYWGNPHAFEFKDRDREESIYVPNAMTICDTTSYYLLKDINVSFADDQEASTRSALSDFLARERFYSKFHTAKQSGVVRGDWIMHITADSNKPQGRRLSKNSVDPAAYFPEYDEDDVDRIIGVRLVVPYMTEFNEERLKVLHYWYEGDPEDPSNRQVWREEAIWEPIGWRDEDAEPIRVLIDASPLPSPINVIPVYHFRNKPWEGHPFGSSEIKGLESLFAAINGTVTDEELALAFQGLGVYATNAPKPKNSSGQEVDWVVAPAMVMELQGDKATTYFERVKGIESVQPHTELTKYLEESAWRASGGSDVARGIIDADVAESGIALAIKFLPMQAKIEVRDLEGTARLENMWFDWRDWMKAYEGADIPELKIELGPKLPMDRNRVFKELNFMYDRAVIPASYYRTEMEKLGYEFPADIEAQIRKEGDIQRPTTQMPPGPVVPT